MGMSEWFADAMVGVSYSLHPLALRTMPQKQTRRVSRLEQLLEVPETELAEGEKVCDYLNKDKWKGPIPQARMAPSGL